MAGEQREDGSVDDFYAALEASATAARARYNHEYAPPLATATYTGHLLPGREDDLRYRAEEAARAERRLRPIVHDLVRQSLLDGREHAVMLNGAALGIHILADQGHETYVAIRIIGSVPKRLAATIVSMVPGHEADTWMPDYAMPERPMAPEERAGPHDEESAAGMVANRAAAASGAVQRALADRPPRRTGVTRLVAVGAHDHHRGCASAGDPGQPP